MPEFNQAFWRWFGASKVVDSQGQPLVVYHATEAKFEVFNIDKCELGCHFGSSEQSQAILPEERGYAIAAYLSIQNPLRLEDENYWDSATVTAQLVKRGLMSRVFRGEPGWKMREMLVKMGYDGIVYDNLYECCGDSWIAFYPEQIKSATGNDGTWDRDDPDITSNPPALFDRKWVTGYCGDFMEILSDALASRGIQARRKGVLASDGRVHHVVLQVGNKLIDARGVLTKEELFAELAAQGGALQPTALVPLTEAHLSGFKCASEEDLDALSEEIELWVENDLLRAL